jgi:ABC-2 type transport system permease protein
MRNLWTITWRELRAYFSSPLAYILSAAFLALSGVFFGFDLYFSREASMRGVLATFLFILLLLAPALTMRLLAEEQRMGTLELLLTAPVHDWQVVVGKYLGGLIMFLVMMVLPTLYYVLILAVFGPPDYGPLATGYLGLILMGASFLAIGVFTSSLTQNQVVALFVGMAILIILWVADAFGNIFGAGWLSDVFNQIAITRHYSDFFRGVINSADVVYALSVIAISLFLATQALQTRRWR